ncbi:MAG: hypothetical protein HC796_06145 [Synechococcaceae cyanobacterium RL_1_2]|nr:hypothetical protein [Synechococcaceae cyanobacterium RL_1_2]
MSQDHREIKIFRNTYELPTFGGEELGKLHQQIQARQAIIKTGEIEEVVTVTKMVEKSGGFLGLGKRKQPQQIRQKKT